MKVSKFIKDFRTLVGDTTMDAPDEFLIAGLNWALRDLPVNPKLGKLFAHHYQFNLDAKGHYKWDLTGDYFDRLTDIPYLHFWASTGGQPCPLKLCNLSNEEFYAHGIPSIMEAGQPCSFTIEREDDKTFLVFDRPLNIPVIVDYIAYGILPEVTSLDDEVRISKLVENAIIEVLRTIWYKEADDMAFAGSVYDYLDNKWIPQLVQEINKSFGAEMPVIVGE